jgi:predicted CopG family antitoxin
MSIKTIAVDSRVYERLASAKREGESFSGTIGRLLEEAGAAHTGRDILRGLQRVAPLTDEDADVMVRVVEEFRSKEPWTAHDLR